MIEKNEQGIFYQKPTAKKEKERQARSELAQKFKDKNLKNLSEPEKEELLTAVAKQLGFLE